MISFRKSTLIRVAGPAAREALCRRHQRENTMMQLPRRQFLHLAAGAAALPALSRFARGAATA